ncbi:MAG: hypothetical protein QM750_00175 [Rubrivivax sp.]
MTTSSMPAGAGPAAPEPQKCEGPGHHPEANADHETQRREYAGSAGADQARKAEATLIARAALAGVELVRLADGTWIASRWGVVKPLIDAEVESWLRRVEVPA